LETRAWKKARRKRKRIEEMEGRRGGGREGGRLTDHVDGDMRSQELGETLAEDAGSSDLALVRGNHRHERLRT